MLEGHHCSIDTLYDTIVKKEPKAVEPKLAKKIKDKADQIQKTTNEREKTVLSAELMALVHKAAPPSLGKKLSTLQTMGQLINPKTIIRNVVGNGLFAVADTSANGLGAILDRGLAKFTGKRTRVMPQLGTAKESIVSGAKAGYEDAIKGIDTSGSAGKFDLPQGHTFKNPILNNLEKVMGVTLKAPDRAFYQLARNESLLNQLKASGQKEITPEMITIAHEEALYKTFQDDSAAAKVLTGIKKALNLNKDFGLGDFVLKYPRTPGNLLSRAFAYSPAGFLKAIHLVASDAMKGKEFNQRGFVDSLSRAMVGTAGIGTMGYTLGKLGLATGAPEKDQDIRSVKKLKGQQPYSINVTGLMRFSLTYSPESAKPQTGDMWISYDWAQPMAIPFSAAVNIAKPSNEKAGEKTVTTGEQVGRATLEATDTLTSQSVVQGLEKFFSQRGPDGKVSIPAGVMATAADAPASFVPTALNQANQALDNTQRDTRDPSVINETINNVKAKVPGLAQTLPARKDVYGQNAEKYQDGSNNLLNVFANPAFVSTLKSDPTGDEALRLYDKQGETQQAPRNVPYKLTIREHGHNVKKTLTAEEHSQYQEYVGKKTKVLFDQMVNTREYSRLNDESKAKAMASVMTDINDAAKIDLFGHQLSKRQGFFVRAIRQDNTPLAMQQLRVKLQKAYVSELKERVRQRR